MKPLKLTTEDGEQYVYCRGCGRRSKPLSWNAGDGVAELVSIFALCPRCEDLSDAFIVACIFDSAHASWQSDRTYGNRVKPYLE